MSSAPICIIGAGASGIAAAKVFCQRGIPFDCYEKGSDVGGLWRYLNDNGMSSAYHSLRANTSRDRSAFADFPMPSSYPDFPQHWQILAYLESCVEHFGFHQRIQFQTTVKQVDPAPDGGYYVTVTGPNHWEHVKHYKAILVANGHHWNPHYPDFSGTFEGPAIHALHYKRPDEFKGRNVLVVGAGNSGCDIACDIADIARKTMLSTRRGTYIIPRYLLGKPIDHWITPATGRLPLWLQRLLFRSLIRLSQGQQADYGLREPKHKFLAEHPTISSTLLGEIKAGRVQMKPNVKQLQKTRIQFDDDTVERVDTIVYATGYKLAFPFFEDDLIQIFNNELPLYQHVVSLAYPNLYFIGLIQPLGALLPLAEMQAEWVADLLQGRAGLPRRGYMKLHMERTRNARQRRYVDSPRHTMQVDFYPYARSLKKERKKARANLPLQAVNLQPAVPIDEWVYS